MSEHPTKRGLKPHIKLPPRPKAMPLRTWLVVLIVAVSFFSLVGSSVVVSSLMRSVLYDRVDEDLYSSVSGWASSSDLFDADLSRRPPTDFCVIHYRADGVIEWFNVNETTPAINDVVLGAPPTTVGSVEESPTDTSWRVIAVEEDGNITVVAKDLTRERSILQGLAMLQVFIVTITLAIIAVVSYLFIRRSLQPLREVEATASQIAGGDLDARIPNWPLHTEVGQLAYALNVMLSRLQASIENAQNKEEQMRRFVGDASHELRTPLTSLRGYTELYRSGATDDVDRVFAKIDGESNRMSSLVEDLLALTRAEGATLERSRVDMLELAMGVRSTAVAAFPGRVIEVTNNAKDIPVVNGDPGKLHQVLLNLVSNGLRHGGPEAEVCIAIEDDDEQVCVKVSDNGRGMSEDVSAHIFERFYRADSSRTRDTGGSGLGLAITKSLVDQHDGNISVDSTEGEGSTFTICLPAFRE